MTGWQNSHNSRASIALRSQYSFRFYAEKEQDHFCVELLDLPSRVENSGTQPLRLRAFEKFGRLFGKDASEASAESPVLKAENGALRFQTNTFALEFVNFLLYRLRIESLYLGVQ
jgi:hypothetical protein